MNGALDVDTTDAISLDADADSNFTVDGNQLLLKAENAGSELSIHASDGAGNFAYTVKYSDTGVNYTSGSGDHYLNAPNVYMGTITDMSAFDLDAATVTIDASSGMSLDAAGASNLSTSAGALTLEGASGASLSSSGGDVTIEGSTFSGNDVTIPGAAQIDGAIDANSTADIQGATNLQSTLTVGGAIDANSTSDFQGAMNLQSTITVAGNADLNGQLDVAGQTDLAASGVATTVRGTLNVDEAATFDSTVTVTGAGEFDSSLGADGNLRVGAAGANNFTVDASTGDTAIGRNLTVTGDLTVNGTNTVVEATTVTIGDALIELSMDSSEHDNHDIGLIGRYSDDGGSTIKRRAAYFDVSEGEYRFAQEVTESSGVVTVQNSSWSKIHAGAADLEGALDVTGAASLGSTLSVTGGATMSSTLGVTGATTLSSTLGVSGAATMSDTLDVTGDITGAATHRRSNT
jgi:hypothetical protein